MNWHTGFVEFIKDMLLAIDDFEVSPIATDEDRKGLNKLKDVLLGSDVDDVEKDLAAEEVKKSTLEKIVRISNQVVDICMEHVQMNSFMREVWKRVAHLRIESEVNAELMRLNALSIRVVEG